ncbi:MAG TPA: hypothetical protein VMX12_13160 [Acidimicrobiia bacterium]|nr:hypothetical protein [Acidimicrobiia bacterium]
MHTKIRPRPGSDPALEVWDARTDEAPPEMVGVWAFTGDDAAAAGLDALCAALDVVGIAGRDAMDQMLRWLPPAARLALVGAVTEIVAETTALTRAEAS